MDNNFLNSPLGKILFKNSHTSDEVDIEVSDTVEDEVFNQAANFYDSHQHDPFGQPPSDKAKAASFFGNMPVEVKDWVEKIEENRKD